jgi:hypothetical protein
LFSTIYAWRTLIYNQDEGLILLDEVMDADGNPDQTRDWEVRAQTLDGLTSLTQPHALFFYREHEAEVRAGVPLAGYLATTVISPDERDVSLVLRSRGPLEVYLNGQKVKLMRGGEKRTGLHPLLWEDQVRALVRLRAGRNTLLAHSRTSQTNPHWFFCGALLTPDGELMTDLVFE